jgi:hypothetical protein
MAIQLKAFLNSVLEEGEWSVSRPSHFTNTVKESSSSVGYEVGRAPEPVRIL